MARQFLGGLLAGVFVAILGSSAGVAGCGDTVACRGLTPLFAESGTYALLYVNYFAGNNADFVDENPLRPGVEPVLTIDREAGTASFLSRPNGVRVEEVWRIIDEQVIGE